MGLLSRKPRCPGGAFPYFEGYRRVDSKKMQAELGLFCHRFGMVQTATRGIGRKPADGTRR
jgi:hypothetical protein